MLPSDSLLHRLGRSLRNGAPVTCSREPDRYVRMYKPRLPVDLKFLCPNFKFQEFFRLLITARRLSWSYQQKLLVTPIWRCVCWPFGLFRPPLPGQIYVTLPKGLDRPSDKAEPRTPLPPSQRDTWGNGVTHNSESYRPIAKVASY